MKNMRKLASVLLVLVMLFALAMPVMAAEADLTGHTYEAYQIFKGTQAENTENLGDIEWGTGVNGDALLDALQADTTLGETFADCETAADVAEAMKDWSDSSDEALAFAELAYANKTSGIEFVSGETVLDAGYYLIVDVTEFAEGAENTVYNLALLQLTNKDTFEIKTKVSVPEVDKTVDDNDANIGDTVTFTLTATMPSTFEGYETYKVIFHDTMSAGLTFNEITEVTVAGAAKETGYVLNPETPTAGEEFTITFADVLAMGATAGSTITVKYTAILNSDAVIGTAGNPNKVYLEYSNDPNWDGKGEEPTGDTPEDEVKVYTWEIPVFKYTGTNTPLEGAGFTLYTDETCTKAVTVTKDAAVTDKNVYKVDPNSETSEIVTDSTGKFKIEGLEKGTYYLKETTTPAGYNTCKNVTVVIGENGALTQDGTVTTEVGILNQAGATLPETGGMGTTLFYVVGGLMIAAAVVLLITKRRMNAE